MMDQDKLDQHFNLLVYGSKLSDHERAIFLKGMKAAHLFEDICRIMTAEELYTYCVKLQMDDSYPKFKRLKEYVEKKALKKKNYRWYKPWTW